MDTQGRGMITERIKEKSKLLLGYEISQNELRFMPYLQFVMVNNAMLDLRKISPEEVEILEKWRGLNFIGGELPMITMSEKFWDIINHLIYLGYVDLNREK